MATQTEKRYVCLQNRYRMPLMGLGTYQSNISFSVETALRIGYRMIDSAFIYKNEEEIGRTLRKALTDDRLSIKREDLFIISKLPNNGHRNVLYFLKKTLDAYQFDYLDLYLIHSPIAVKGEHDYDNFPLKNGTLAVDKEADILETWKSMEEAVDLGLVKNIGLSNFRQKQIERIYENSRIKPSNLQVECNPFLPQKELYEYCKRRNITFTAYAPLGAPFLPELAVKFGLPSDPEFPTLLEHPTLSKLGKKHNKSPAQIILRWLTERGIAVIPKSSREDHLRKNFNIFDFNLDPQDHKEIDNIETRYRFYKFDFLPGLAEHPENPFSNSTF